MQIATVLNVHADAELVIDTLDSIQTYLTDQILLVVDGAASGLRNVQWPVKHLVGLRHGCLRSPYRNVALGLKTVTEVFPNADWYCYLEYDCLVGSARIRRNLEMAQEEGVWILGNAGRLEESRLPFVEEFLGQKFRSVYYLLGCCQFLHRDFMRRLQELQFFERFLHFTNSFSDGFFPDYTGYDLSEHLYPTLARHLGGKVGVFATYDEAKRWHGHYQYFPMRWRPELDPATEDFPEASLLHPLKTYDHPIRVRHRESRKTIVPTY